MAGPLGMNTIATSVSGGWGSRDQAILKQQGQMYKIAQPSLKVDIKRN